MFLMLRNKLCNKWEWSMRKAARPTPHKRDGIWYLVRRVPNEFAQLDRRGIVRVSTGIAVADDPRAVRASSVVLQLDTELQAYWRGLRDGQSAEARIRFEAAQKRARALGLPYQTAPELSEGAIADLLKRVNLLVQNGAVDDEREVAAVLGGEQRPALKLSGLLDEFEEIQKSTLGAMSEDQKRKWRNPKKRAVDNLISVITDKAIGDITRSDAVAFRKWWQDRIATKDLDIGTANKDFGHISKMLHAVDITHQMGLKPVFARLRIEGAVQKQRAAFLPDFVQEKILAPGALDGLNDEARDLVYLIADTGMRLSEAANLRPENILLDAEIPHVQIRANGRKLKTDHSARDIPLVGAALEAMRRNPKGFPRYRHKADSLSALVNKVLDGRKLLPTPDHSLYSLRHTFEDRLTAVEAPEKVVASLMGHKWIRPKYGAGPTLEQKRDWLQKIAFKPPVHAQPHE